MGQIKIAGRYFRMYPTAKFEGYAEKEFVLDPAETVFLIVDVLRAALILRGRGLVPMERHGF